MTGTYIRTIARAAALLALAGFVASIAPAFAAEGVAGFLKGLVGANSPYPVVTARHIYRRIVDFDGVYWLDNDRVLFVGHDPLEYEKRKVGAQNDVASYLVIWNMRTGEEKKHSLFRGGRLCYHRGYIRYVVEGDGKTVVVREGRLGDERETRMSVGDYRKAAKEGGRQYSWLTCRYYNPKELRVTPDHQPFPLREEHGYLDFTGGDLRPEIQVLDPGQRLKVTGNAPVRYYRARETEPIDLPFIVGEVDPGKLRYSEWADVYVLYGSLEKSHWHKMSRGQWPKGVPQPVYLLTPEVKVTTLPVPYKERHSGSERYVLTRAGLVLLAGSSVRKGAFLLRDGQFIRLTDFPVVAARESPDGCKLAVAMEKDMRSLQWLSVVDLCK